ncbi:MAG: hypothetical protein JXQ23_13220, partial [Clostridia bacterium]|nr:hypothetical protein [Clostridia bacterium]
MKKVDFGFDREKGTINCINMFDGISYREILFDDIEVCHLPSLSLKKWVEEKKDHQKHIHAIMQSRDFKVTAEYEIYDRGYVICTFQVETLRNNTFNEQLKVGIHLDKSAVFSHGYDIRNNFEDTTFRYNRATSVNFTTDDRIVTNSVDFLLENLKNGKKVQIENEKSVFLGWEINLASLNEKGNIYKNRWCVAVTGINNDKSNVRGQRIYHFNGLWPRVPDQETMIEMAEYGCSVLVLHMPVFTHIDGSVPYDEKQLIETVMLAHKLQMKVLFYCQPALLSLSSPKHDELASFINNNGKSRWNSLKDTQ